MKDKLKFIVADDERPARKELIYMLKDIEELNLVGEAKDGIEAIELIKEEKPDLLFLDIQMPGKNGIEVAKEILTYFKNYIVIFITAYDQYALKAFEVNAIDYLLKPFEEDRLLDAIAKVKRIYSTSAYIRFEENLKDLIDTLDNNLESKKVDDNDFCINKFPVRGKRGNIKLILSKDIVAIYTKGRNVYAKTNNQEYQIDFNLLEAEEKLKGCEFLRVHRSYLINLNLVKEIIPWFKGKYQVVMMDEKQMRIPISRSKVKTIQKIFGL
ncbi:LytR/AlgR family response regulator transcription factor [Halonatronum saccharophilum]|uniref:LytR/AlgR family response regulator transcription factor n=1 Tax=Halonatronum saccharophilum TaxID=150060 RepID=UPI0004882A5A|nr:LytTR family DNA-binding domain-containing protein [Halonatronum saccharophilum]